MPMIEIYSNRKYTDDARITIEVDEIGPWWVMFFGKKIKVTHAEGNTYYIGSGNIANEDWHWMNEIWAKEGIKKMNERHFSTIEAMSGDENGHKD